MPHAQKAGLLKLEQSEDASAAYCRDLHIFLVRYKRFRGTAHRTVVSRERSLTTTEMDPTLGPGFN